MSAKGFTARYAAYTADLALLAVPVLALAWSQLQRLAAKPGAHAPAPDENRRARAAARRSGHDLQAAGGSRPGEVDVGDDGRPFLAS